MSMENAILQHADALREVAEAIRSLGHGDLTASNIDVRSAVARALADKADKISEADSSQVDESMSKPSAPAEKVQEAKTFGTAGEPAPGGATLAGREKEKRETPREEVPAIVESDAELDEAVAEIEQRALDYKNDVRPVLLQVAKKDKAKLTALLAKYDAKDGPSLSDEHYGAILADANEYLAA